MIEKLTTEELKELIDELKKNGYVVKENQKGTILKEEGEKLDMPNLYVGSDLKSAMFIIADWATENYTRCGPTKKKVKNKAVDVSIEDEYRRVLRGILKTLKPYFGRLGFDSSKRLDGAGVNDGERMSS